MRTMSILVVSLLLAACGSKQEANDTNLTKAIDDFGKNDNVCLPVNLALDSFEKGMKNTISIGNKEIQIAIKNSNGDKVNKTALKQMEILTDADLYKKDKNVDVQLENGKTIPMAVYHQTAKGESKIVRNIRGALLCVGSQKVDKIVFFTEPTPANGVTVSKVVYDAKLEPEKWAEKLLKTTDKNWWDSIKEPQRRSAVLVLTDKGWKDERTLH